jgi:hypothetical protein
VPGLGARHSAVRGGVGGDEVTGWVPGPRWARHFAAKRGAVDMRVPVLGARHFAVRGGAARAVARSPGGCRDLAGLGTLWQSAARVVARSRGECRARGSALCCPGWCGRRRGRQAGAGA